MTTINVAEWRPDAPDLSNYTDVAVNVIARTPDSYGPLSSLSAYNSSTLNGPCIGAVAAQDFDLTVSAFAGTEDKLYQMTAATASWVDVSGAPYTTAAGDTWHFELFARYVLATNFSSPIQVFQQGTSTAFADLSADAPHARYLCTPKNFVMAANTFDPVGGLNPSRIWWSASNDPTSWPIPGSALAQQTQSDYNDFQGSYGEITGIIDSLFSADVAIFFEHAVWRGVYVGPPDVFDFFPAENVRGCPYPNSIVTVGALVYYRGEDGFYAFDGTQSQPIGANKFDAWFVDQVNQNYDWNVIGAADVTNKMVIWIFPSRASSNGIPDTMLLYRWDIQRATTASLSMDWLARFLTFGATLDTLSAIGFPDLDTIPFSLDSRAWIGDAILLGAIDTSHRLAFFSGAALAAQVGMQTVQLTPGRMTWLSAMRPLVQLTTGTPTIAVAGRNSLYDPIVYGAPVAPNAMGECPQRSDARYHDTLFAMPAGAAWTHVSGVEIPDGGAEPSGER